MKLLNHVAAIVSLVFVAVGLFWLGKLGLFGTGLGTCILALPSAVALSFGLYILHLRDRIAALERRMRELP